jgi:hypothetical protein
MCIPFVHAAACAGAAPLTEATTTGEYTAELLEPGTLYFVQPSTCQRGQVVVVNVACDEVPAVAGGGGDGRPPLPASGPTFGEPPAEGPAPTPATFI